MIIKIKETGQKCQVTNQTVAFLHLEHGIGIVSDIHTTLPIFIIQKVLDHKGHKIDVLKELKKNSHIAFNTDTKECLSHITTNF